MEAYRNQPRKRIALEWRIAFVCGEEISVNDPFFNGYITLTTRSPEVERELEGKTAIARSQWYAKYGYWYDLVSTMARARQDAPDNPTLTRLWESLLASVSLERIATQPLLGID
ncbi:MAG: DUF928 domain-containing protein [Cyanobacteria bacterium P01_E01_bin.42]